MSTNRLQDCAAHTTRKEEICLCEMCLTFHNSGLPTSSSTPQSLHRSTAESLAGPSASIGLLPNDGRFAFGTGAAVERRLQRIRFYSCAGCANSHNCNSNGNNSSVISTINSTTSLVLADTFFRVREPAVLPATVLLLRLPHQGVCPSTGRL